jgi:exodeoxyribonuclease V alpha subunit
MSDFRPVPVTGELLVDDWRALDRALFRWVRAHGGSMALATLAAWCSWAQGEGHTALLLDETADPRWAVDAATLDAIRTEALVGDGHAASVFVLDVQHRFRFWRDHTAARGILHAIDARCAMSPGPQTDPSLLEALFAGQDAAASGAQRDAVRRAPMHALSVLTGGPGTGKTSTVLRMLLAMQHAAQRPLAIQVAAPTGKAAQRLLQSLRDGAAALATSLPAQWQPLLATLPAFTARTLHRLLGYRPQDNTWAAGRDAPLAADVVVIDEASMIDLALLRRLFDALRPETALILVGDPDQLSSVAPGAALADVVALLGTRAAPQWLRLDRVFRARGPLVAANVAIRAGDRDALDQLLDEHPGSLRRYPLADQPALRARLADWTQRLLPMLRDAADAVDADGARHTLRAMTRLQLLCALREGPFGAEAVDRHLVERLRLALGIDTDAMWFPGRLVMVTQNDASRGLFNGDVGVALPDAHGELCIWFASEDERGVRPFTPSLLPAHEGAFAITIHKSQGSEYDEVALLLPPDPSQRVLSRQLLYTGASRARERLQLWSTDTVLGATLARPLRRMGGF